MTATLAWIDIAHGTTATTTVAASIQTSTSMTPPNHLHQNQTRVGMQLALFDMQFHHVYSSFCIRIGELIDVSLTVICGDEAMMASNA